MYLVFRNMQVSMFVKKSIGKNSVFPGVHINTKKHQNTGKQPKYQKAYIKTKKQWKILVRWVL